MIGGGPIIPTPEGMSRMGLLRLPSGSKEIAHRLAESSVVTKALGVYLHQVLDEVDKEHIKPLEEENRRFREALEFIANYPVESSASMKARVALGMTPRRSDAERLKK